MKANSLTRTIRNLSLLLGAMLCFANAAHAEVDPPSRVARLNYFDGTVTFAPAGSDDWARAYLNRPLTAGDRLWVDQGGRSELHIGSTALRLGDQTSLDILTLDDSITQLRVTQGTLNLRVRALFEGESFEIDTPNLAFTLQTPGEYRIDVNPNGDVTTVTVRKGRGIAYGDGDRSFSVNAQQQVSFSGTNLAQAAAGNASAYDGFDRWIADRDRREDASVSARYVSREMTGYEELDAYGAWRQEPGYGAVWVPAVTVVDWAPYHYGHWAWVAPWGWTWVDEQPWGFAPFHYGRWAWIRSSWCWVPGPVVARPVYAPALVAFVGGGSGSGVQWGVSVSGGSPGVAWFPLAPGEVYRPAYATSPVYVKNINKTVIVNQTVNIANVNKTVYVNQQVPNAVTAMPAAAFVKGQPVQKAALRMQPAQLANVQVIAAPALAPVKQSFVGNAAPSKAPPPEQALNRRVIATRAVAEPPAVRDTLAQKFAAQNGTAPGAGEAQVRVAGKTPNAAPNVAVLGSPRAATLPAQGPGNTTARNANVPEPAAAARKPNAAEQPPAARNNDVTGERPPQPKAAAPAGAPGNNGIAAERVPQPNRAAPATPRDGGVASDRTAQPDATPRGGARGNTAAGNRDVVRQHPQQPGDAAPGAAPPDNSITRQRAPQPNATAPVNPSRSNDVPRPPDQSGRSAGAGNDMNASGRVDNHVAPVPRGPAKNPPRTPDGAAAGMDKGENRVAGEPHASGERKQVAPHENHAPPPRPQPPAVKPPQEVKEPPAQAAEGRAAQRRAAPPQREGAEDRRKPEERGGGG